MKLLILAFSISFSLVASAQSLPWSDNWGVPIVLTEKNTIRTAVYHYTLLGSAFKDIEAAIAETMGKQPGSVKVTPDYVEYRFGSQVMYRNTPYSKDVPTTLAVNAEIQSAMDESRAGTLTKDKLTGPNWIHTIQAIDVEEANCLALSRKNGKASGCGDQWQDGLTDDKLVCFKGKTYIKCHVKCLEKIYKRDVEEVPGPCGDNHAQ